MTGKTVTSAVDELSIRFETLPTNTASLYAGIYYDIYH